MSVRRTREGIQLAAMVLVILIAGSCASVPKTTGGACRIAGPLTLAPRKLGRLRLGLPKSAVDRIMGTPTYSPTAGQYYYPTGGDCRSMTRQAECSFPAVSWPTTA